MAAVIIVAVKEEMRRRVIKGDKIFGFNKHRTFHFGNHCSCPV